MTFNGHEKLGRIRQCYSVIHFSRLPMSVCGKEDVTVGVVELDFRCLIPCLVFVFLDSFAESLQFKVMPVANSLILKKVGYRRDVGKSKERYFLKTLFLVNLIFPCLGMLVMLCLSLAPLV